jgi:hypothetical protein
MAKRASQFSGLFVSPALLGTGRGVTNDSIRTFGQILALMHWNRPRSARNRRLTLASGRPPYPLLESPAGSASSRTLVSGASASPEGRIDSIAEISSRTVDQNSNRERDRARRAASNSRRTMPKATRGRESLISADATCFGERPWFEARVEPDAAV